MHCGVHIIARAYCSRTEYTAGTVPANSPGAMYNPQMSLRCSYSVIYIQQYLCNV